MDKYLQYDHLELSEDPSFIRWAKGSKLRSENNWEEWLKKHPEKAETIDKAKSIVLAMKFSVETPSTEIENKVWTNISTHINSEKIPAQKIDSNRSKIISMLKYGAAAAAVFIILFQFLGNEYDTSVNVPFAEIERVTLPDGSEVAINSGSELKYDTKSWDDDRTVALKGEAFFSVEKGSRFTVKTNQGTVHVLGTSFNVYDREKVFKVQCETGKVAVKSAGQETILIPNQSVSVTKNKHNFQKNVSISERRSTWQKGIFVYKEAELADVLSEIERQFDVTISINKSFNNLKYNGSFTNNKIDTALTEVLYPLGLKYEIDGKTILVRK